MILRNNKLKLIDVEIKNNGYYTISDLMQDPTNEYDGVLKESIINVNVEEEPPYPEIKLETLSNKRLQSETVYTVSDLMTDSQNYDGITKESTLVVDLPDYPPTYEEGILNLTGAASGTLYPSAGVDYFDKVRYTVTVDSSKIKVYGIFVPDSYNHTVYFTQFLNSSGTYYDVPAFSIYIYINKNFVYNNQEAYLMTVFITGSTGSRIQNISSGKKYYVIKYTNSPSQVYLMGNGGSGDLVVSTNDNYRSDNEGLVSHYFKSYFEFMNI